MGKKKKILSSEISDVLEQSDISEKIKKSLYEYLLSIRTSKFYNEEDFILRIPEVFSESFRVNQIFHLKQGHLEKITKEFVALSLLSQDEYKSSYAILDLEEKVKPKVKIKTETESFKNELKEIKNKIDLLQSSLETLKKENTQIKELLFSNATNFGDSKITQTLPIDIYLDTDEPQEIFEVYDAVIKFIESIGFEKAFEFDAINGSWYKRFIAKSKDKLSSEDVQNRLKEAEYGIEVNTILKQQSEIDKNQSEALANIITSLKDIPNAAIRIGALIVVKITDKKGSVSLQTRTLSIKELHLLNKKPELLQMPKQILQALAKEIDDNEHPRIQEN